MHDSESIEAIATADLIVQVDATRSDYDLFKLSRPLLSVLSGRLTEARAAHAGVALAGQDGASASQRVTQAWKRLGGLLCDGFHHLRAIPEEEAPATDVVRALETYGYERGELGAAMSPSRIEILVQTAAHVTSHLPATLRYPKHVLTRMTTWSGVLDANKRIASGGAMETITDDRNRKRELLLKAITRVRHHYCTASDDGKMNPELARVGLQSRLTSRDAAPLPAVPSEAAFQSATRRLTIPALPTRAHVLVAWRRPGGEDAELAGVSTTAAVGVSNFSPLKPGVAYQLWVTGRNASGDGPESNRLTFTAEL
jgi:hypothetical protein